MLMFVISFYGLLSVLFEYDWHFNAKTDSLRKEFVFAQN